MNRNCYSFMVICIIRRRKKEFALLLRRNFKRLARLYANCELVRINADWMAGEIYCWMRMNFIVIWMKFDSFLLKDKVFVSFP